MANEQLNLYQVTKQDIEDASKTLTEAFFDDTLNKYFFPEEDLRLKLLPEFFKYRIKTGILYGKVLATSDSFEGVVIITPSENHDYSLWKIIRAGGLKLFWKFGRARIKRMLSTAGYIGSKRKECITEPYWYLGSLGVLPEYQGKGFASRLIRPVLDMCTSTNWQCILDTQNEDLIPLYEHFGFKTVKTFDLPELGVQHWIMAKTP